MYNAQHSMSKANAIRKGSAWRTSLLAPLTSEESATLDRKQLVLSALIFLSALLVRLICWYYARAEAFKVQTAVTNNYKRLARLLIQEGFTSFFDPRSKMSDVDLLGHPPGYSFLLAFIYKLLGESDAAVQFVQITADAFAAVVIFLIAAELLSKQIGMIAGLLAALSPQFSWNSILLLPDTISVLPILLAIYLLVHYRKNPRCLAFLAAGVLIGISTLLRANSLLLAPFLAAVVLLCRGGTPWPALVSGKQHDIKTRGVHGGTPLQSAQRRFGLAACLMSGALIVIAPITIRNAVVFKHFVPISLGAGQTLLEGIADYDPTGRFGIPETDVGIAEMEAKEQRRPDYATTLFGPDGIKRERTRLARGTAVIKSNPFWFMSVMIQRSLAMLRFERVPIISLDHGHRINYPTALRFAQRVFLTSIMLPLAILGALLLMLARRWQALVVLSVVPAYYFCFQSALHTEYRYVIALNYFELAFAAIALYVLYTAARKVLLNKSFGSMPEL